MGRVRGIVLGALIAALVLPAAAGAATLQAPGGFRVEASDGFLMQVLAVPAHDGSAASVLIRIARRGESVLYGAPAIVEEDAIEADLGALGRIDVRYVPDGRTVRQGSPCVRRKAAFDGGFYEGTIKLRGEEGYASVDATRAPGDLGLILSLLCVQTGSEGFGGHSPGARLTAQRTFAGGSTVLDARINSPTRPSRFEASISETHGRLHVFRSVRAVGPPAAFSYDVPRGKAVIAPPLPFAGVGRFQRRAHGPGRFLGNLAVDFPGHSDVHLGGPSAHATLIRYVDNPSHPFRPEANFYPWLSTKPWPTVSATFSPIAP
jgi:hypothetical protein